MLEHQKLDAKQVKEQILRFLKEKGPSLPVAIAKATGLSTLFASAFLSEMASEGMIKISNMKVGGSPLYYTPDKFAMLENFTSYLESKEQEACALLKTNGILEDAAQQPAIRVALRSLKDFAFPFKKNEKIFWRYFTLSEEQLEEKIRESKEEKIEEPEIAPDQELEKIKEELEEKKQELEKLKQEIELGSKKETQKEEKSITKKPKLKKRKDDRFLNEIKEILAKKQIELLNLEQFDKKQVFAKVKVDNKEYLLAAYNKKKLGDSDLIRAYKKASALNLPYTVLSKGELSKKTREAIDAYKRLATIDKIEKIE